METLENCKNCGTALNGIYCGNCGQKIISERITVKKIFRDIIAIITNVEKGFWYTTKKMFTAPGEVILDTIGGKTIRYYNPFRYAFIWATVSVLLTLWLGIFDIQQEEMQELMGVQNERQLAFQQAFNEQLKNYLNFFILLALPFTSFMSYLLLKKQKWNYAEHLILNAYVFGQNAVMGLLSQSIFSFFPQYLLWMMPIGYIINISFLTYVFKNTFKISGFSSFWRAVLTVILGFALFLIACFIMGIIFVIAYALIFGLEDFK